MLLDIRARMLAYTIALTASPVQFGVWVMAFWFTSNGPAAYLTCTSMLSEPMNSCTTTVFGFVPVTVNLCHALCHFSTGIIGLAAVLRRSWAIVYATGGFVYYVVWGLWGLVGGDAVRHHLGVDIFGSWVHVVEGLILIVVWSYDRLSGSSAKYSNAATFTASAGTR
ncbi:DUF4383 domain-containing protein [Mycolicibacterium sp. 141076]|uniref:DUF4383 domain-containing protein n=1 Tax=Mycobacteriaceae TaxID=1762 RepID=UPI00299CF99B|nr:DUF4383 domain-containing protein [Mycolicibacterium sp. 141076]MDX1879608.1 DUF4383 domain-containing protein [Mycolicibacterium sp. 141076]